MFAGFKKFIMRGNVMELAVAVIIGSAFTAIVTAFTKGIIEPLLVRRISAWVSTSVRVRTPRSWISEASSPPPSTSSSWQQ